MTTVCISGVLSLKYEKLLDTKLLEGIILDVLPEPKHGEPVKVEFGVRIQKLIKLDMREQVLTVNAFTMMRWNDAQLKWNKSEYGNLRYVTLGSDKIWTPDVVVYNTADEESNAHTDYYRTKVTIYSTGDVLWIAPVTWKVSCSFDVTWFPIDQQTCNITFGSWTYTFHQIDLSAWTQREGEVKEHFMVKNGEWRILEKRIYYQNMTFPCCDEPFSAFVYQIVVSRLSLYYFMYILLPLISLAFIFLMVFYIPYDTERMGFGVTVLLSITVYLLVISEELPEKSDDKSMLGLCFIIEFYMLCAALGLSLLTNNLSRKTTEPPELVIELYNKLRRKPTDKFKEPEMELEVLHPNNTNNKKSKEKSFNEQWVDIALTLDKFFLISLSVVMFIIPIIVCLSLDRSGLGTG